MKFVKQDEKEWLKMEGYFKKILLGEKELESRNLVQVVRVGANSGIRPHYHKQTIEACYVLKGSAILFFGDKKFKTKPGDVFLCEPKDVHGVINNTDKEFLLLVLKINTKKMIVFG